jgi:hypothetical protein
LTLPIFFSPGIDYPIDRRAASGSEAKIKAAELRLMLALASALERINEAAFEMTDVPVFEEAVQIDRESIAAHFRRPDSALPFLGDHCSSQVNKWPLSWRNQRWAQDGITGRLRTNALADQSTLTLFGA